MDEKMRRSKNIQKANGHHLIILAISIVALTSFYYGKFPLHQRSIAELISSADILYESQCPIRGYHRPSSYNDNKPILDRIINDESFRNSSLLKLQNAVRIKTEVHDNDSLLIEDDFEYWSKFDKFQSYLSETFQLFYSKVELHKVNYHGLIYIWQGSNPTLKPLLLMAHQDTVPVDKLSIPQWDYPPFEAEYDGTFVYGRGVADCKNLLIGLFESAEELMRNGFEPQRTVIFSFGFDEEVGGIRNQNARWLEEKFGNDSMYAILDEGGVSLTELEGVTMAIPGTGEKGYLDISIVLESPGGHSSTPPNHTSIGVIGELIVEIENDPFPTYFTDVNPSYWQYVCLAENSIEMDPELKKNILTAKSDSEANLKIREYIDSERSTSYAIKTTQALDIICGGSKANSLPEYVELSINSRVAIEESVETVVKKFLKDIKKVAQKYDIGLVYENDNETSVEIIAITENGHFKLLVDQRLNVAPVTPTDDSHWYILSGTIRHLYEELAWPDKYANNKTASPIVVSPGLGSGNTDTRHNWNLSKHIYRYRPGEVSSIASRSHGVNEYIKFDSHLQIIAFYFEYIQSVDEVLDDE